MVKSDCLTKSAPSLQIFTCGSCSKKYRSYTSFYNQCKREHEGKFPDSSSLNGQAYKGPSEKRGRPKRGALTRRREGELRYLQLENDLFEFLGSKRHNLKTVFIYVEDPFAALRKLTFYSGEFGEAVRGVCVQAEKLNTPEDLDPLDSRDQ
jgi:hypothetical protein